MNTTSLAKSMNGALSVTDGEITIEEGQITFSDGSVLSSIGDIALKSANNTFTGVNTISNTTLSTTSANGALVVTGGVGIGGSLNLNGTINNMYLITKRNGYMLSNNNFSSLTGGDNIIIGLDAGRNISTGSANITIGYASLYSNETGSYNTAIGHNSGGINSGSYNTFLGYNTFSVSGAIRGGTAIGYNAVITEDFQIALGSNYINHYVKIPSAKVSSSYTTGALVVAGGVGIAGNLNLNGALDVLGVSSFKSNLSITSTTSSSSYTTGALVVAGGVGIAGNLRVNGRCIFNDILAAYSDVYFSTNLIVNQNITTNGTLDVSGASVFKSDVSISSTTLSSSYTNGALVVSGGVGIAKKLIVNENITTNGTLDVSGASVFKSDVSISSTTLSSSYTNGALVVSGGVGIAKKLIVNENITTNGTLDVSGASVFKSDVSITSTKISSSYTNGALVVAGGVGIAGNLRVNGRCIFNDILSAYNDVYFSTNLVVNQNMTVNTDLTVFGKITTTSLNFGSTTQLNKLLTIYDNNPTETDPTNTTNFFGLGINPNTLRYQAAGEASYHTFYNGSMPNLRVGNNKVLVSNDLIVGGTTSSVSFTSGTYYTNYNTDGGGVKTVTVPLNGLYSYIFGANYNDLNITNTSFVIAGGGSACRMYNQYNAGFSFTLTPTGGNTFTVVATYPAGYNNFSISYTKIG